jgi:hypothetical protein
MWALVAIAGLAAAGCKKDEGKSKEAGPAGPGTTPAGQVAEAPAGAGQLAPLAGQPATAERLLAVLPMDTDIVMGLDFGRMRQSTLLAPLIDELTKMNQSQMGFDMKAECGLDPAKMMGIAVFGIKMISKDKVDVSGAMTGIPRGPALTCMEKSKAKMEAEGAKVTIDGNYVMMTTKDGNVGMAYVDDTTMVMKVSNTAPVDKAALDKMVGAKLGGGLTGSPEFMGMIKATNTGATLWGLVNGNAPVMASSGLKFKAAFGSVDVTDGVVADGRLRMTTPDDATKNAQMFATQLVSLKGMGVADVAEAKADGNDVVVKVQMTPANIQKAKDTIGPMLGGMLGGMGGGMGGP